MENCNSTYRYGWGYLQHFVVIVCTVVDQYCLYHRQYCAASVVVVATAIVIFIAFKINQREKIRGEKKNINVHQHSQRDSNQSVIFMHEFMTKAFFCATSTISYSTLYVHSEYITCVKHDKCSRMYNRMWYVCSVHTTPSHSRVKCVSFFAFAWWNQNMKDRTRCQMLAVVLNAKKKYPKIVERKKLEQNAK